MPDVIVTLNEIFRLPNDEFINMSELPPGEYQYRYNNLMAITFTPDGLPAVQLKLNGQEVPLAIGEPINYIDYNRTVIQKNCAFFMPTKMVKNQSTRILISYDTTEPPDKNYLEYSLLLKNVGNKKITDYRANVCLKEGLIKKVNPKYYDNFIKQSSPSCVEIRVEKFMPGDHMETSFYADTAFYNSDLNTSFNSYDENGKISNEKFTENFIFLLPNCTLVSDFGTVELLKE